MWYLLIMSKWVHYTGTDISLLINYSLHEQFLYSLGDISIRKPHLLNLTILNNLFVPKATC